MLAALIALDFGKKKKGVEKAAEKDHKYDE